MSEAETTAATTAAPPPEHDSAPQEEATKSVTTTSGGGSGITLSIWPPTQRTRDAVTTRLVETLSTPSVLSKRYGTIQKDEATAAARRIEEEAYGVADAAASSSSNAAEDDGLEILQLYSKEISKRMLDTVKSRAASGSAAVDNSTSAAVATEEISSSVETEA